MFCSLKIPPRLLCLPFAQIENDVCHVDEQRDATTRHVRIRFVGDHFRGRPHEHHHGEGGANAEFGDGWTTGILMFFWWNCIRFQVGERQILRESHAATNEQRDPIIWGQFCLQLH